MSNKKIKFNTSRLDMFLSITTGLISLVFLTVVLYFYQAGSSMIQYSNTSRIELSLIDFVLNMNVATEDVDNSNEIYKKKSVQVVALMLKNEELSNDALASVSKFFGNINGMLIFDKEGNVLYSYGNPEKDRDFLLNLAETRMEYTDDNHSYTAVAFQDNLLLAIETEDLSKEEHVAEYIEAGIIDDTRGRLVLPDFTSKLASEIMVVNQKTGMLTHAPAPMRGKNINNYLLSLDTSSLGFSFMFVNDSLSIVTSSEHGDYLLLSAFAFKDMADNNAHNPALLGFGLLVFLLVAYVEFIRTDMRTGKIRDVHYVKISKKRYLNTVLLRRISAFGLIGISAIMVIIYCLQLLSHSDIQRRQAESRLDIASVALEDGYNKSLIFAPLEEELLIDTADTVMAILDFVPSLQNQEDLNSIAQLYDVSTIYMIDSSGKTVVSSSGQDAPPISTDMQNPSYPLWDVINGFSPYYLYYSDYDVNGQEQLTAYVGVPQENSRGMVLMSYQYGDGLREVISWDMYNSLWPFSASDNNMLLAINPQTGMCEFDSSNQYTGLYIDDFGIEEKYLRNGYSGTHMFNNRQCHITSMAALDTVLLYVTDTDWIVASSWIYTLLVFFVGLFVLTLTLLPHLFVFTPGDDLAPVAASKGKVRKRIHVDVSISDSGEMQITESTKVRQNLSTGWKEKDAGAKLRSVVGILMGLAATYLLIVFIMSGRSNNNPFLEHIFERNWDKRFNIYAVSYVLIVLTAVWFVASLLQKVTAFVAASFGWRWKTSGILISNIIRYAAFIASIFFTLHNLGVETSALATSASILTLVVGFGSQSLVSDLIAGIFLIFEGAFHVGDIVTIDNWRGEVIEVGLRTTKVKNELGNVKIFQNSRIYGAINMTSDQSFAVCDVAMPQGETLEAFEEKLRTDFFGYANENVSNLKNPLEYEGVIALNGNNTSLRFSTKCIEADREQLQRDLYRSFRLWQEKLAAEKSTAAVSQEHEK